jgi:ATP-dependent exoDNAse (exonuclease V) alpha subunit
MTLNEYITKEDIRLSDSQSEAVCKISSFLTDDTPCFILKGFAGTGKTFITAQISRYLESINRNIQVLTPTGRSAKVASEKLQLAPKKNQNGNIDYKAQTIHRGIYQSEKSKDEDGYIKRIFSLRTNRDDIDSVYFIDESSMLSDRVNMENVEFGSGKLLSDLIGYVNQNKGDKTKLIFVGDSAQLTPINMSFSPALSKKYIKEKFGLDALEYELTEVFRQDSKSGILFNATNLRTSISNLNYHELKFDIDDFNDMHNIEQDSVEKYVTLYNPDDLNENLLITHSTAIANDYNKNIRTKIFNLEQNSDELVANERLICIANNYKHEIFNGEFITIKRLIGSVEERVIGIKPNKKDRKIFEVKLGKSDFKTVPIKLRWQKAEIEYYDAVGEKMSKDVMLNITLLNSNDRSLSQIQSQALTVDNILRNNGEINYDDEYSASLVVKYGYAVVGHKAQGGEWNNVIIDFNTHDTLNKNCEEYFRWCYTAITRAKKNNFLVNVPESVNLEESKKFNDLNKYLENF